MARDQVLYHGAWVVLDHKLTPKMKERYLDKIARIKNDDSYILEKADFCKDISRLPALRLGMRHIKVAGGGVLN